MRKKRKNENKYQADLKDRLYERFPDCIVMKNDPSFFQGVPDLLILHNNKWAALECKKSCDAEHQPNQDYYVDLMNKMSFASFIYPENEEEVLNALQSTFESGR